MGRGLPASGVRLLAETLVPADNEELRGGRGAGGLRLNTAVPRLAAPLPARPPAVPCNVPRPCRTQLEASAEGLRRQRKEQVPSLLVLAPTLPYEFSVHHTKAFYCFYPTGVRVIIYTANNPREAGQPGACM